LRANIFDREAKGQKLLMRCLFKTGFPRSGRRKNPIDELGRITILGRNGAKWEFVVKHAFDGHLSPQPG
jgi:hypothetical protein